MIAQPHPLVQRLDTLWVEPGLTFGHDRRLLTVFPLRGEAHGALRYAPLDAALAAGTLEIREADPPSVNLLHVVNRGDLPVLITDGEELVGGRQNRVTNSTTLSPRGRTALPVSCVERGRWRPDAAGFAAHEAAYPALRQAKVMQVRDSLRVAGIHRADQAEVWASIAARQADHAVASDTEALRDLYDGRRERLDDYARALPAPRDVVGLIVAYGGRIAALEVFDAPATLGRLWPKLVRAAALDALALPPAAAVARDRACGCCTARGRRRSSSSRRPGSAWTCG